MTECERLVAEGIVEPTFLEEEIRDEYPVSVHMKKVWAIYLDLYQEFCKVCNDLGLTHWVTYGTLLGAARHKGFIPWDDDFDVMMPRADYDKLLSYEKLFADPYVLQTTLNQKDYYFSFARLRNSRTTAVSSGSNPIYNNGIYLDIMPLDGIPVNGITHVIRTAKIRASNLLAHAYMGYNEKVSARLVKNVLSIPMVPYDYKKAYKRNQSIARRVSWNETSEVGFIAYTSYSFKSNIFQKDWFNSTIMLEFENTKVAVPSGYEDVLTTMFGDYLRMPNKQEREARHEIHFEPDVPYELYFANRSDFSNLRESHGRR